MSFLEGTKDPGEETQFNLRSVINHNLQFLLIRPDSTLRLTQSLQCQTIKSSSERQMALSRTSSNLFDDRIVKFFS